MFAEDNRLNVERQVDTETIAQIDKIGLLGLNTGNTSRTDLFLFALALGIDAQKRTPLATVNSLVREASVNNSGKTASILSSLFVDEMRKINEEEKISDISETYKVASEYANTGFHIIQEWLDDIKNKNKDEESIMLDLLEKMDEKYLEYFE